MRRWLPLALLVVLGALGWLALRERRAPQEEVSAETAAAHDALSSPTQPLEHEAAPSIDERTDVASAGGEAKPRPQATAHLSVRTRGKSSQGQLPDVWITASPAVTSAKDGTPELPAGVEAVAMTFKTDGDGVGDLRLSAGISWKLSVTGESKRYAKTEFKVDGLRPGEQREMILDIQDGADARLFGRVVAGDSGEPVAGARISVIAARCEYEGTPDEFWEKETLSSALTSGAGTFDVPYAAWRYPHLRIEAAGFGPAVVTPFAAGNDSENPRVIQLSRSATLEAHVLGSSGKGLAGVTVSIRLEGWGVSLNRSPTESDLDIAMRTVLPPELRTVETGPDGVATFRELPSRAGVQAEIRRRDAPPKRIPEGLVLEPGETLRAEWQIGTGTRIDGVLVDQEDRPIAGQTIWLQASHGEGATYFERWSDREVIAACETDEAGRFALEDVWSGSWWIGPAPERARNARSGAADLAPFAQLVKLDREPRRTLTLKSCRGLYIRGRVVDPDGNGLTGCGVLAGGGQLYTSVHVFAERDGSFALGPLMPGDFTINVRPTGPFVRPEAVRARAGDEDITIRVQPAGLIRGHVLGATLIEENRAYLFLIRLEDEPEADHEAVVKPAEPDGSFRFDKLPPGRFAVLARDDVGGFALLSDIAVASGTDSGDLALSVKPGGKLKLKYAGGSTYAELSVWSRGVPLGRMAWLESGVEQELDLPDGPTVLEAKVAAGRVVRKSLELKSGETTSVELSDKE